MEVLKLTVSGKDPIRSCHLPRSCLPPPTRTLAGVLAVAVCAVLAGARSFAAIGEWAVDLREDRLGRLGPDVAPVGSTMRKPFARLDGAALDRRLAVLAWTRTRRLSGRRVIAVDAKTVRGARSATTAAPHLVAALDHVSGVVPGQDAIAAKSNEIPAVRDLLAGFDPADLHGCAITSDAMHTQDNTAKAIVDAGAYDVFTVKGNRPTLPKALKELPWNKIPIGSTSLDRSHGRRATRTIKVIHTPRSRAPVCRRSGVALTRQLTHERLISPTRSWKVRVLPAKLAPGCCCAGYRKFGPRRRFYHCARRGKHGP